MSESSREQKPRICRLCLALTNISFSLIGATEASGMLEALTSLRILPADEISTVMCLKCSLNLKLAFKIQQNMLKAERQFHERLPAVIKDDCDFVESEILEPKMEKSEYTCDICGKENSSSVTLTKHKYNVHQTVECPKCLKKITRPNFRRHMALHKDADLVHKMPKKLFEKVAYVQQRPKLKEYVCDLCGKSKPSQASLNKHKYDLHVKIECPTCFKEITQVNFKRHVEAQHINELDCEKVEYTCEVCGKGKFSKLGLSNHRYNVHTLGECPICKKTITRANLKRHIERHTDPRTVCKLCGTSVKQQDLRVHMYYVHRNSSYKCEFCDKVFKSRSSKVAHEKRYHLGEANFVCDTCGKKFYKSDNLRQHIKIKHLKMRPHICDFCKVGFSSKFALITHRRQHTNERPFKCQFCGEGFRQKATLKSHLSTQHDYQDELTCECNECGKKFASGAALFAHRRVHM